MQRTTKHTEKFVHIGCVCLKAPKWWVLVYNSEFSIEVMEKEKAKPVELQNTKLIAYHRALNFKRKQELKSYNFLFN